VSSLRVLVVRLGAMGDVLHALPAVAALRARRPDAFIGWAIEPRWADLLQVAGDEEDLSQGIGRSRAPALVDRWYSVPSRRWRSRPFARETLDEIVGLKEVLRDEHFDVVVDLQGLLKSAVVGRLAGSKAFTGPAEPRERLARRFYRNRFSVTRPHVVEQACELLGAAVGETLEPARVVLPMEPEHEVWADREIGNERFCLLAPSAGWGAKQWPAERYGDVARELSRLGYGVLVSAPMGGDETAARVRKASGGAARVVPSSLGQLIAMVRRAELVIGGDTGPLHLAAALDHPVVGLYGPTSPERNGPWATRCRVLRDPESTTSLKRKAEPDAGLLRIEAAEVIRAAMELLEISDDGW
jgi:heptosyltransferase-1